MTSDVGSAVAAVQPLVRVRDLTVSFRASGRDRTPVVQGVSFDIRPSSITALVGESGSGKSVTARTLLGLTGPGSHVASSCLEIHGRDVSHFQDRQWRRVRGKHLGFVLQDAHTSLDPLRPVGKEIEEALKVHGWGNAASRQARVLEVLRDAGVPFPRRIADSRPGQLSGGQRQRALIAQAMALKPQILIADEPTTALDASVQAQILDLFVGLKEHGCGILLITHDLSIVGQLADDLLVLRGGKVVESGETAVVLANPSSDYTRALLSAIPTPERKGRRLTLQPQRPRSPELTPRDAAAEAPRKAEPDAEAVPALEAVGVSKRYHFDARTVVTALDDVSFRIDRGRTLGLVGESGSGKSTLAWIAAALIQPDDGQVLLNGHPWTELHERQRRDDRHRIQVIYQDPLSSFDPRHTVEGVLQEALRLAGVRARAKQGDRVAELLESVGLPTDFARRRPLNLSGGQRQRLAIARALARQPQVLILDEPVSALDVSVQATILDLLLELQRQQELSYLFISHDLGVVYHVSDDVLVLKDGRVVESGTAEQVLRHPRADYTRTLVAATPAARLAGTSVAGLFAGAT